MYSGKYKLAFFVRRQRPHQIFDKYNGIKKCKAVFREKCTMSDEQTYNGVLLITGGADKLKDLLRHQRRHKMHGMGHTGMSAVSYGANAKGHLYTKKADNVSIAFYNNYQNTKKHIIFKSDV